MMKFNLTNQNNKLIKQREEAIKKHNEVIRKHNESVKERRSRDLFSHKNLYPITFSIPESKVININEINIKTKLLSSLIPGVQSTYIYNNEADYYDEYKKSFFATTVRAIAISSLTFASACSKREMPVVVVHSSHQAITPSRVLR